MIIREGGKLKLLVPDLDCEEVKDRILALTRLMKAANFEQVEDYDRQLILTMIEDHLPSGELLKAG